jgi:hypothetical protein
MSTLMITLLVAFIATVFAITCLAIGWLISGRSRIVRGSCGMNPKRPQDASCGKDVHCAICEPDPTANKKEPTDHDNTSAAKPKK